MAATTDREQRMVGAYLERTLENDAPELKPYLKPRAKVLDIGCGPGTITLGVAEVVNPGEVIGLEPAGSRVDIGSELAQKRGLDNVTFVEGNAQSLDFPDDTFDVVYSHTVLHHLSILLES